MRQYTSALCKNWSKWSFFVEIPKKLFFLDALCFVITEPVRYALTHMPANKTPWVYTKNEASLHFSEQYEHVRELAKEIQ